MREVFKTFAAIAVSAVLMAGLTAPVRGAEPTDPPPVVVIVADPPPLVARMDRLEERTEKRFDKLEAMIREFQRPAAPTPAAREVAVVAPFDPSPEQCNLSGPGCSAGGCNATAGTTARTATTLPTRLTYSAGPDRVEEAMYTSVRSAGRGGITSGGCGPQGCSASGSGASGTRRVGLIGRLLGR